MRGVVGKRMTINNLLAERTKFVLKLNGARAPYEPRDPRQFSFSFLDDD